MLLERIKKSTEKGFIIKDDYPEELKKFIVTLHYKSPSAYNYVREIFNFVIPHHKTIRTWYRSMSGGPGHNEEAYRFLKKKCESKKETVCLSLDDIHIMSKLEKCGNNIYGGVDIGNGSDNNVLAKMALTLMVHSLEEKWKISPGFFFHSGLKANEQKDILLQAIVRLWETNVVVVNITCDGN